MKKLSYPLSPKIEHIDDYHGTLVSDPYRWLEDDHSPETHAWVQAQNATTQSFLSSIPERALLKERLTQLWNYAKMSTPIKKAGRYFYFRNTGLQNQDVLYSSSKLDEEGEILLDPNTLSDDASTSLKAWSISPDGRYLAYGISQGGSDWTQWRIREVSSKKDLDDILDWSKFSGATWLPDSSGFYYQRYPEPKEHEVLTANNTHAKLYLHHVASPQSDDELIYENPHEPQWYFSAQVSDDNRYIILSISRSTESKNLIYYSKLGEKDFKPLLDTWDASYRFVGNDIVHDAEQFYFLSDKDADFYQVFALDIHSKTRHTLIAERSHRLLDCHMLGDSFIAHYLEDAKSVLKRYDLQGHYLADIALPDMGSVVSFTGKRSSDEYFYSFSSYTQATSIYRYDAAQHSSALLFAPKLDFDSSLYTSQQIFVRSKDGTAVPMTLVHKKGLVQDGTNPTLLYGYGGFNISLSPSFNTSRAVWLELGGIMAIANLRGGGEYGAAWHKAGTVHQKQNVFDDFIACAKYLIKENYTSSKKLAIQGGSNGGLLVGACMTQEPELFAAAVPMVGVLDMLRFDKFTIGWAWVSDYGSAQDLEQFKSLYAYSPLHQLKEGQSYPATLIMTSDHDDRVVPAHSFKFAATLQEKHVGDAPVLIRIQEKAGHSVGKATGTIIEEQADIYAFLVEVLAIRPIPIHVAQPKLYKKILVATDGSDCSSKAIKHAIALAALSKASLHFLHAIPQLNLLGMAEMQNPSYTQGLMNDLEQNAGVLLQKLSDDAQSQGLAATSEVLKLTDPSYALEERAKDFDLIVMGSHGRSGVKRLLLGSVTEAVLRHVNTPVLVVSCKDA